MPDLPTVAVTDDQADRILAAFQSKFKTPDAATTISAYRKWLTAAVVDVVVLYEAQQKKEAAQVQIASDIAAIRATLPVTMTPEEQARADAIAAQLKLVQETTVK
jgi:hypothetical protein